MENFGVNQSRDAQYMMAQQVNLSGHHESTVSTQRQFYSHVAHNSIGGVVGQDNNKLLVSQMYNRASPGPYPTHQDHQRFLMNMSQNHYQSNESMQVYQQDKMMSPQVGFSQIHPSQMMATPNQPILMQKNINLYQMGGYPMVQANMQQVNLGMQYDASNGLVQSYPMEGYVNQMNGLRPAVQAQKTPQHAYNPQQPKQLEVWKLDLSSPKKLEEFKKERYSKVIQRLGPYLDREKNEDLKWSIENLEKWYNNDIKELIEANTCSVNASQVKRIFKFVQKTLETSGPSKTIDNDEHLQSIAIEEISKILKVKEEVIEEEEEPVEQESTHEESSFDYNYYQHEGYQSDQAVKFSNQFRQDLDFFLHEVQRKKNKMKDARQKVISKIMTFIATIPHIKLWEIYGSYQTNLDLPWSDIDFVVYSENFSNNDTLMDLYQKLDSERQNNPGWITKIDYYSSATVPIIKMVSEADSYEINLDITFKDEGHRGSDCVTLVKQYLEEFENLDNMVMIL